VKARTRKVSTTIRPSLEVLAAFRADGPGSQTRIDNALKDWLKTRAGAPVRPDVGQPIGG